MVEELPVRCLPAAKTPASARLDFVDGLIHAVAVLVIVVAVLPAFMSQSRSFRADAPLSGDLRFQTDNAVGATANATEWLATHFTEPLFGNGLLAGLALWLIASLRRTRIAIERLADELAPLKSAPLPEEPTLARRGGELVGKVLKPKKVTTS